MAEWERDLPYAQRVDHLLKGGGLNGPTLLNPDSYLGDDAVNMLTGGAPALDLFFGALARDVSDFNITLGESFVDPASAVQEGTHIDATALTSSYISIDYVAYDPAKPFTAQLQAGTHVLIMIGGAMVYFTTDDAGKIDYDTALEGILSGRGTKSLQVNGAAVTIDGTSLTSDYLSLDTMGQDKTKPFSARLLPGTHSLATHGGAIVHFTVGNSGKFDYDASLEGILTGRGTDSLRVHGAAVTIDATALSSDILSLNYKAQDKTDPFGARLIPGQHVLATHGGAIINFTVTDRGTIDYDPILDDVLSGRGTSALSVSGQSIKVHATGSYVNLNYKAFEAFDAGSDITLLPGQHSIFSNPAKIYYFTMTIDGLVDYDTALEGIFTGRGTRTLRFDG
jgi:hypothetical protein